VGTVKSDVRLPTSTQPCSCVFSVYSSLQMPKQHTNMHKTHLSNIIPRVHLPILGFLFIQIRILKHLKLILIGSYLYYSQ